MVGKKKGLANQLVPYAVKGGVREKRAESRSLRRGNDIMC